MPLDSKRVQAVFGAAIESDAATGRGAVLDRECSTDTELRRRVEALLGAHDLCDSILDKPIVGSVGESMVPLMRTENHDLERTEAGLSAGASEGSGPDLDLAPTSDITIAGDPSPGITNRVLPSIAGYEIQEELGRGGMGVVYKARQIRLDRPCALKMILGGAHAGPGAATRFLAEAQAIARLQHPHIVQIHYIGEAEGLPFFELEYIDGGSLDKRLDGTPWTARRAAALVELLAGAVAEAHRLGIVHRDLKPANILLLADGTPKITDFGLAKSLDSDAGLTATDSIMGSPTYMAPEQAAGQAKQLGPRADVYALGVILYEVLTGRPPFRGATILETLEQVKTVEPVPPSRLVPGLPRDIETIAQKCLQKEPGKRYDSAAALAEDLRRFLSGESILARPVPGWERAWRWCRRHPAPAALTAAVILVAALGLTGILWQWSEAVKARNLASKRAAAEAEARRETEATLVDMYTMSGIAAGDQGEYARAALWFANAARRSTADPDRRFANAVRARTWGRRAFTPRHAIVAEGAWPAGLALHPGGRWLIVKNVVDGSARDTSDTLWDLESERRITFPGGPLTAPAAAWSPDGGSLAVGGAEGDVVLARFPGTDSGIRIRFAGRVRRLVYSADGQYLAIAGGNSARVWNVRARAFATPVLLHPAAVTALAFDPKGRFLATGCLDNQARLFGVDGGAAGPLWPPVPHLQAADGTVYFPVFCSPPLFVDSGRGLITYSAGLGLTWRSVESGAVVRKLDFPDSPGGVAATELSPDGRFIAVIGFQSQFIRVFEVATGQSVGRVLQHDNTVTAASFSADSRMLATGSTDNTVRVWSVPGGEPLARPLDLHRSVRLVVFAPHGRSLLTQDADLVRQWDLPGESVPTVRVPLDGKSSFVAFSPDGVLMIPTGTSYLTTRELRSARAYRVADGRPAGPSLRPGGQIIDVVFSPDGRSVATLAAREGLSKEGQEAVSWDWASGRPIWRAALPSEPRSVSHRSDGRRIAVLCAGGELLVFDAADGHEVRRWHTDAAEPVAAHWINNGKVCFSPDGQSLLTWGMGNDAQVWEAETGRPRYPPILHRDKCHDLQFSRDGRSMVLASYDRSVRVRDVATGRILAELPTHPDIVYSADFSADGRLVVTACRDRMVRIWDWRVGRLACSPFEHAKEVVAAKFTPDGRWVISASDDGTARVWDWRTGKPVTPPITAQGNPRSIAVTPDARHAVGGGFGESIAVLDLGDLVAEANDLDADVSCVRAELLAGQRLHDGGGPVNLSADDWLEAWRAFPLRSTSVGIAEPLVNVTAPATGGNAADPYRGAEIREADRLERVSRFERADSLLSAGRINLAIATGRGLVPLCRRVVAEFPDEPGLRHTFALALVLAGDRDGYRLACASTVKRFGDSQVQWISEAARACVVGADAVSDTSAPRRMAEVALARDPESPFLHYLLGLAHFREGRNERAVAELARSLELRGAWPAVALNYPVMAMAHHRLGHGDEERRWLHKAHGSGAGSMSGAEQEPAQTTSVIWWDRVEFQLLLREADALILEPGFPADPFAP